MLVIDMMWGVSFHMLDNQHILPITSRHHSPVTSSRGAASSPCLTAFLWILSTYSAFAVAGICFEVHTLLRIKYKFEPVGENNNWRKQNWMYKLDSFAPGGFNKVDAPTWKKKQEK